MDLPESLDVRFPRVGMVLRQHGSEFAIAPRPAGLRRRRAGACFRNAALVAMERPEFTYCEGLALTAGDWWGEDWVRHAWCLNVAGLAVEVTWKSDGARYVGIAIPSKVVATVAYESGQFGSVLDQWQP